MHVKDDNLYAKLIMNVLQFDQRHQN